MAKVEFVRCACGESIPAPAQGEWSEAFPALLEFLDRHRAHCQPNAPCFSIEARDLPTRTFWSDD